MKDNILYLFILGMLFSMSLTSASIINNGTIGFNSSTYQQNLYDLSNNFFTTGFNVTQEFTNGTDTLLWVPWFTSSSTCGISSLHGASNSCNLTNDNNGDATINMTNNCMVSDEFSEIGIALAYGTNQTRMNHFMNTVRAIKSGVYGSLPMWEVARIGNRIVSKASNNDSASDASARVGIALYIASTNPAFADAGKKAEYLALANILAANHLTHETKLSNKNSTISSNGIGRWLASGGNVASNFQSGGYAYTGYYSDVISFMLMAANQTGNIAYRSAAANYTEQYLIAAGYDGGITSGDFVTNSTFNFNWAFTVTNIPYIYNTTDDNSYFWYAHTSNPSLPTWDSVDAPRILGICDNLRNANLSGVNLNQPPWTNLTDYCNAYSKSSSWTPSTSCVQYKKDGTCYAPLQSGYFENGLGALMHTYYNQSIFKTKIDTALAHYSFSTKTYNSAACYGVYNGIRPLKALAAGIGADERAYGSSGSGLPAPVIINGGDGNITITLYTPTNGSSSSNVNQTLGVLVVNNNITFTSTRIYDITPKLYNNFTASSFSGYTNGALVGTFYNISGNIKGSPDTNISNYTSFRRYFGFRLPLDVGSSNAKYYYKSSASSNTGGNIYFENNSANGMVNLKHDGGFETVSTVIGRQSNVSGWIDLNFTSRTLIVNFTSINDSGYTNWSQTAAIPFSTADNSSATDGNNASAYSIGSRIGDWFLTREEVWNTGVNWSYINTTYFSATMNVSFFNLSGSLLGRNNSVGNNTVAYMNWSNLGVGTYSWYVSVTNLAGQTVNSSNYTFTITSPPDITPPSRVTGLAVIDYNSNFITWNWTNPTDSDYNGTLITIDDLYVGQLSSSIFVYNLTGLTQGTTHNISITTIDNSGNVNSTFVFNSFTTQPFAITEVGYACSDLIDGFGTAGDYLSIIIIAIIASFVLGALLFGIDVQIILTGSIILGVTSITIIMVIAFLAALC